jgi:DNA segregation ATPase FtsK/SpoIIIE-like protein
LKELVKWNFENSELALTAGEKNLARLCIGWQADITSEYPNQDSLVAAIEVDHDEKRREELSAHIKAAAVKFTDLFGEYDVNVIMAPTDSPLFLFSGAGGK